MISICNLARRAPAQLRRGLCIGLSLLAGVLLPISGLRAELVSTQAAIAAAAAATSAAEARTAVGTFLSRDEVRGELAKLGISADEARARVAALSDTEVEALHGRIQEQPAGASTLVGVVGGFLVITITVLVVTDLLGYTDVFPFIRPLPRPSNT